MKSENYIKKYLSPGKKIKFNFDKKIPFTLFSKLFCGLNSPFLEYPELFKRPITIGVYFKKLTIPRFFKKIMRSRINGMEALHYRKNYIFLHKKASLRVNPGARKLFLYIKKDASVPDQASVQQLIQAGFFELLRWKGIFLLHASGISKKKKNILLVGNSGSGKSSVALSAILAGWKFLSDDLVFIRIKKGFLQALSYSPILKCNSDLYKTIKPISNFNENLKGKNEISINIPFFWPKHFIKSFSPNIIVFLYISNRKKSKSISLSKRSALFKLINQSATLFLGNKPAQKHLMTLSKIAETTSSFHLSLGRDLYRNPLKVSKMLFNCPAGPKR